MAINKESSSNIPILDDEHFKCFFSRMDPVWKRVEHVALIANQKTLSGKTYDHLQSLAGKTLPITRAAFIRVWKSFILMRVQDIFESIYYAKPENYLDFDRKSLVPATLFDLLNSLGSYRSLCTGRLHYVVPPAKTFFAIDAENFWTTNEKDFRDWKAACDIMRSSYTFKEYPSPQDTSGRSIVLTCKENIGGKNFIKAITNEPVPEDAFIRFVNDELFARHSRFNFDRCALDMISVINETSARKDYIRSYILKPKSNIV